MDQNAAVATPAQTLSELTGLYRLTDQLYRAASLDDVYDAALDAIVGTLGCDRASILLFDDHDVMRFVAWLGLSDSYRAAVDGHTPWNVGQTDPEPIFVRDIAESDEPQALKTRIMQEGIRGIGFIPIMANRTVIGKFMTYYDQPHDFAGHEIELAVAIARQVGFSLERARAEQAREAAVDDLRHSEERFRLMSEQAPVMIWTSDTQGRCLHLNRALRTFWGVAEADISGFDWTTTMHPEDVGATTQTVGSALRAQTGFVLQGRFRNFDGEFRVMRTEAQPHFSAKGVFLGMTGVNVDITERARADEQRELLLAELNHRVKNTLAVVQGIAHQTFKGGAATPAARAAFEGRLVALAAAHSLLTQANWQHASLEHLAAEALQATNAYQQRVSLSGPRVLLQPKEALAIALALHELCTNAVKYGAFSNDSGRIAVEWKKAGADTELTLTWREEGGPPVSPPTRRGFGSYLVERMLADDLDGEVSMEYRPEGLVCSIRAPLRVNQAAVQ
jgi:PAS domain S-box-containing protein